MKSVSRVTVWMSLWVLALPAAFSLGAVDLEVLKTLEAASLPEEAFLSRDGQWIYVLTTEGDLLRYSGDGLLSGRISIKKDDPSSSPVDVAVSWDSRWVYVLTNKGELLLYSEDGRLQKRMNVGSGVTSIGAGPSDGWLLLSDRKSKTIRLVSLNLEYDIQLSGSPFKGPANAPVVVAVYSDFQ